MDVRTKIKIFLRRRECEERLKRVLSGISVFSVYGIYTVFSLIIAVVLLNFLLEPGRYGNGFVYLAGLLLAMIFGVLFFGFMARLFSRYNEWKVVLFLVTVCFAVKFSWIWFFRIEPAVDYATFYYTAVDLSNQFVLGNRYVALFPPISGYLPQSVYEAVRHKFLFTAGA